MANASNVKGNLDGLNELTRMLKEDYTLKVGIIGSKAKKAHKKREKREVEYKNKKGEIKKSLRTFKVDSNQTNAEIGTFHEFGTEKMPQRSFLWMPLCFKLNFDKNPDMQEFKKVLWRQFFIKKSPLEFYQALAEKAMSTIEWAFQTNGGGMWKPLSPATEKHFTKSRRKERVHEILTDTGQLRRSISFKISKRH